MLKWIPRLLSMTFFWRHWAVEFKLKFTFSLQTSRSFCPLFLCNQDRKKNKTTHYRKNYTNYRKKLPNELTKELPQENDTPPGANLRIKKTEQSRCSFLSRNRAVQPKNLFEKRQSAISRQRNFQWYTRKSERNLCWIKFRNPWFKPR